MADYTVNVTVAISISAPNKEKAEERALLCESWVNFMPPAKRNWLDPDVSLDSTVEDD